MQANQWSLHSMAKSTNAAPQFPQLGPQGPIRDGMVMTSVRVPVTSVHQRAEPLPVPNLAEEQTRPSPPATSSLDTLRGETDKSERHRSLSPNFHSPRQSQRGRKMVDSVQQPSLSDRLHRLEESVQRLEQKQDTDLHVPPPSGRKLDIVDDVAMVVTNLVQDEQKLADRVRGLEDMMQGRSEMPLDATRSEVFQAPDWLGQLESKVASEIENVMSEMRTGYASIERLATMEDMMQRMLQMNTNSQILNESERLSLLENEFGSEMSKVSSDVEKVVSEMRAEYASVKRLTAVEDRFQQRLTIMEDMVQRAMEMNIDSQMLKESDRNQAETRTVSDMSKVESEINKLASEVRTVYASIDQMKVMEDAVQRMMAINIESQLLEASERLNVLENTVAEDAVKRTPEMNFDIQMLKESARVSILENKIESELSEVASEINKVEMKVASEISKVTSEMRAVENTMQRFMERNIEAQTSKEEREQIGLLQDMVASEISKVTSEMERVTSEMRTGYASVDKLSILEERIQGMVQTMMETWVEAQINKEEERIRPLHKKVTAEMSKFEAEITKVALEMRTKYTSVERITTLENTVQALVEQRIELEMSKESERIGLLEGQVTSGIARVASDIEKVASEMRTGYASVHGLTILEDAMQRRIEKNIESQMAQVNEKIAVVENLRLESRISALETSTAASEMQKALSEIRGQYAILENVIMSENQMRTGYASIERLSIVEDTVKRLMEMNIESQIGKVVSEMDKALSEIRTGYASAEQLNMVENSLTRMKMKESERVGVLENEVRSGISRLASEIEKVSSAIRTGYASVEQLTIVENTVQRMMEMNMETQKMHDAKESEMVSMLENMVASEINKFESQWVGLLEMKITSEINTVEMKAASEMSKVTSEMRAGYASIERLTNIEDMVKRIMGMNIESQMLRESERVSLLEKKVASEISKVTSEMEKVLSEMGRGYATVERLTIMENTVQRMMEMNLETQMTQKGYASVERLDLVEATVQRFGEMNIESQMSLVESEISKVTSAMEKIVSEMPTIYASAERVTTLEDMMQRKMENKGLLDTKIASEMSKIASETNKIATEMRTHYVSVEGLNMMEEKFHSKTDAKIDSKVSERCGLLQSELTFEISKVASEMDRIMTETARYPSVERVDMLESKVEFETSKVTSEIEKVASEMRAAYASNDQLAIEISKIDIIVSEMQTNCASAERLIITEGMVQRIMEMNIESQLWKESQRVTQLEKMVYHIESQVGSCDGQASGDRVQVLEDKLQTILADGRVGILEEELRAKEQKAKERVGLVEEAVRELRAGLNNVMTGYASLERLTVTEGKVKQELMTNLETQMVKESERLSLLEDTLQRSGASDKAKHEFLTNLEMQMAKESERLSLLEDTLQRVGASDKVRQALLTNLETQMLRESDRLSLLEETLRRTESPLEDKGKERVDVLEETVNKVESEISKVASEMQTVYLSSERLTMIEGMVQRISEMNIESKMSTESERVSKFETKFTSELSKLASQLNKVAALMNKYLLETPSEPRDNLGRA